MTTNLSDSNTSTTAVHSESQIVLPSTLSSFLRDSYASGIQKALADREGQESSTRELSCSMVCADMEGVKLDLLILQKKIEENANLLSANIKKQEELMALIIKRGMNICCRLYAKRKENRRT